MASPVVDGLGFVLPCRAQCRDFRDERGYFAARHGTAEERCGVGLQRQEPACNSRRLELAGDACPSGLQPDAA